VMKAVVINNLDLVVVYPFVLKIISSRPQHCTGMVRSTR
jgi:hypothetical protein